MKAVSQTPAILLFCLSGLLTLHSILYTIYTIYYIIMNTLRQKGTAQPNRVLATISSGEKIKKEKRRKSKEKKCIFAS